jgi:signal transduction histidine kinase
LEAEAAYATAKPQVRLVRDLPSDLPPFPADPSKLKIVLRNLLANAFKFTEMGSVTITARAGDGDTTISIADTGIGIAPDVLPIIFDPYRQGERSMTGHYGGVGLGLYIVRRMLDVMGGTVSVESDVGRGATFRVSLAHIRHGAATAPRAERRRSARRTSSAPSSVDGPPS